MNETCPICGRLSVNTWGSGIPGTPINKVCFREKGGADTTCYQVGYERSQAALAAARRECEGLRKKTTELAEALSSAADDISSSDVEGFREALREGATAAKEIAE